MTKQEIRDEIVRLSKGVHVTKVPAKRIRVRKVATGKETRVRYA